MFTIKYRAYNPVSATQGVWIENEQIHGPFDFVSMEHDEGGRPYINAHHGADCCMTFSRTPQTLGDNEPQHIVWVMNEQGATVAKYDL